MSARDDPVRSIACAESLKADDAVTWSRELSTVEAAAAYAFDFGPLQNIEPFGANIVASAIRRFTADRAGARFTSENHSKNSFAAHYGFWQAYGIPYGKSIEDVRGGDRFIPIQRLDVQGLLGGAKYSKPLLVMRIDGHARRIARVMCQGHGAPIQDAVTYAIREIVRNAIEHSGQRELWFAAQFWPNRNRIEVAIVDEGCGIRDGLQRNPEHCALVDEVAAIRLAMRAGVTGTVRRPASLEEVAMADREYGISPEFFENSGYGLFVVGELCRRAGNLLILSNDRCVRIQGGDETISLAAHRGTAVRLVLHTDQVEAEFARLLELAQVDSVSKLGRVSASVARRISEESL